MYATSRGADIHRARYCMNKRLHTIEKVVVEEEGEMAAVEDEVGDDDDEEEPDFTEVAQ